MKQINYFAHFALLGAALIYAGNYSIAKIALDSQFISPNVIIMFRLGGGALLLWLISFFIPQQKIKQKDWSRLFICVLCGACLNMFSFFNGLKFTTPINASLLMILTPLIVLTISLCMKQEKLTWNKVVGMLVSSLGATILLLNGQKLKQIDFGGLQLKGDILILTNALLYGIYLVFVKSLMEKYRIIHLLKWLFTLGFLISLPFVYKEMQLIKFSTYTILIWMSISYIIIGTTVLTYLFNSYAISKVKASIVSVYVYLQPFLTTIIAVLLVKDQITMTKIVAALFILSGIILSSITKLVTKKTKFGTKTSFYE